MQHGEKNSVPYQGQFQPLPTTFNHLFMKKILFLLYPALILLSDHCSAQIYSQFLKSDTIAIDSKVFRSKRKIILTRPLHAGTAGHGSNCIVYMDAQYPNINGMILQSASILITYKEMPESYLVGIIQEDRDNELLEKERLLAFLTTEVVPLLEEKYHIGDKLTVAGHSFGAYFATYAFLKHNEIFNACIAVSPAYWPNKEDVLGLMKAKITTISGNFYLAVGDKRWDELSLRDYVVKGRDVLRKAKGLRLKFNDLNGFSHNATPTVGFGLGLSFIYDEWEWGNILQEQEIRLKSSPGFWGHLEIKADALSHLHRLSEAREIYQQALQHLPEDQDLSKQERTEITKRLLAKAKTGPKAAIGQVTRK